MTDKLTFLRKDSASQNTSTIFHTIDYTAANFDVVNSAVNTLQSALDGLTHSTTQIKTISIQTKDPFATKAGQRELKWLLRMDEASTGKRLSREVGPADTSVPTVVVGNRTFVDPGSAEFAAVSNAIANANIKSEDGNALSLVEIELVGRNI